MLDRFAVLALAALYLLAPGLALAEDDDDFTREGWYVGVGALYALESFNEGDVDNHAGGVDVTLGYRASPVVSVEAEYEWAGFWRVNEAAPEDDGDVNVWTLSGNVKGTLPLGRFQPYAIIGAGLHRSRIDRESGSSLPDSSTVDGMMKGGVGLDVHLTRHLVLGTEVAYSALFNRKQSTDYLGVGVGLDYRF